MSNQDDEWLSIREASLRLGVSELTVRRRIKAGAIAHRLSGGKYFVNLDRPVAVEPGGRERDSARVSNQDRGGAVARDTGSGPEANMTPVSRAGVSNQDHAEVALPDAGAQQNTAALGDASNAQLDLGAFIAQLARTSEQAGRAEALAQQIKALEDRCRTLEQGTVALAARNGWLESKVEEREREVLMLTDAQPLPSWWQRLLRIGGGES